jgi:outer membrane protein OmpA-like peptidoglycan-associated protein
MPGAQSDSGTGFYKLSVPTGTYVVECRRDGYTTARSSTPVVIKKGETTILNFQLEKIGTEEVLLADVTFEFNKADLRPSAYPVLDVWVKKMKDNPYMQAEIQGHTDAVGSSEYNQALSERRANAVAAYLISRGIESFRLIARGYGETQLLIDTQAKEERNRRVVSKNLGDIKK